VDIWSPDDLQQYLTNNHIPAEIIHLTQHTPTVPTAADALGVEVDVIIKTVIFFIAEQPYAVLANGVRRVDQRKLAAHFGVNRKKIKLANGEQVIELTGYAPGTVPPFGHRQPINFIIESDILQHETVYAGGGGIAEMLKVRSVDLRDLTKATPLAVLEDSKDTPADQAE
jgi:prolyl-tRNA editing enzyme YbaK/EbsC (Cys-tRNA(Pro) deacylase)